MDCVWMKTEKRRNPNCKRHCVMTNNKTKSKVWQFPPRENTTKNISERDTATSRLNLPDNDVIARCVPIKRLLLGIYASIRPEAPNAGSSAGVIDIRQESHCFESSRTLKLNASANRLTQTGHVIGLSSCSSLNKSILSFGSQNKIERRDHKQNSAKSNLLTRLTPHSITSEDTGSAAERNFSLLLSSKAIFSEPSDKVSRQTHLGRKRFSLKNTFKKVRLIFLLLFFKVAAGSGVWW